MSNPASPESHPFWSLTPEALNQPTAPIAAEHGSSCICRGCASASYDNLLQTSNYQRHEIARLTSELARVKFALAVEKFRRLTLVIAKAVADDDKETWAKAVAERMGLGVAAWEGQEPEVVL